MQGFQSGAVVDRARLWAGDALQRGFETSIQKTSSYSKGPRSSQETLGGRTGAWQASDAVQTASRCSGLSRNGAPLPWAEV